MPQPTKCIFLPLLLAALLAGAPGSQPAAAQAPTQPEPRQPAPARPDPAKQPAADSDSRVLERDTSGTGPAPRVAARAVRSGLVRGPYLQQPSPSSILVAWRTAAASNSRVYYGSSPDALSASVTAAPVVNEHRVLLTGLQPDTRYYYAVGSSAGILYGDASTFFFTAPPAGAVQPLRLWVIGDSGTADINAQVVYRGFLEWNRGHRLDGWLMLGDNAYPLGTEAEYQHAVFEMYPELLRQLGLSPVYGNHDGQSANSATQTGPYYELFEPPSAGQAGGVPSRTEAYYSFDLGNVHVAVLDSYQSPRAPDGAMARWLDADLAAAAGADWLIVAFHHPPYSKGSHDSDSEDESIGMRQNLLPILEARGVDLVLTGHSHGYERSMLIDGHYGLSTSFGAAVIVDPGDGRIDGDGPYLKPAGIVPHAGTVYATVGISGSYSLGGVLNHPAMVVNRRQLGSLVLDVVGDRLDARVIDPLGGDVDHFTIVKGADPCPPEELIPPGATFRYRDDGIDLGVAWRQPAYADGAWPAGPAELGYGDGDEATVIGFGPDPNAKYPASYFRRSFAVADPASVSRLALAVRRDDAVAVYLNGVPVLADNFASHSILFGSWAARPLGGAEEQEWLELQLDPALLRAGGNLLAAEVHQASPASSDLSFDLALRARRCARPPAPSAAASEGG